MRTAYALMFTAALSVGSVGISSATADLIATRQVSTGDIAPMLYQLVHEGDQYAPISPTNRHVQLFNAAVDNGSLAFVTSISTDDSVPMNVQNSGLNGIFVIDDLTPDLHTDGTTNLNVQSYITSFSDEAVGRRADLPLTASLHTLVLDARPNGVSLSNGNVSFASYQNRGTGAGLYEAGPVSAGDVDTINNTVPSVIAIADPGTTINGDDVAAGAPLIEFTNDRFGSYNFARDGDRTVFEATMDDGARVLASYDSGTGSYEVLFRNGGANPAIDLPDGNPFNHAMFVDADGGEAVFVGYVGASIGPNFGDRIYHLDDDNNASLLLHASGEELGQIEFDGGDVVVGRHSRVLNAYDPIITTRARGKADTIPSAFDDQGFLGPRYHAIARFDETTDSLIDLVNTSHLMPGGGPAFEGFGTFSYSDGNLAFLGSGLNSKHLAGLFVLYNGELHEILKIGDTFDGRKVLGVDIHRDGLDGDLLAFTVTYDVQIGDYTYVLDQSIYTMNLSENFPVPEPSSLALLGVGGSLLCRRGQERNYESRGSRRRLSSGS